MGIIIFQNCEEDYEQLFSTLFYDSRGDEFLENIQLHDILTITLDIDAMTLKELTEKPIQGLRVQKKFLYFETEESNFEGEFDFEVVKRVHNVAKDWMNDPASPQISYRESSTAVVVQASSVEAQALFFKIQRINAGKHNG